MLGILAHPTRFERVTFAFGGQTPTPPISEQRIYSVARMGCCKPLTTTPQRAALLRVTLPSETALWLFHDVDRRRKLKGRADDYKTFARTARKRMRTDGGGYRRDHLRALAQRVEVDQKELRIMGSKSVLLRTLVAASSAKTAGFGVPSSVPKWRTRHDSNV